MTLKSTLRASIAIAFSAAAAFAMAQTAADPGAPANSISSPSPGVQGSMDTPADVNSPAYSTSPSPRLHYDPRAACAGLADRQTERACKERYRSGEDMNPSTRGNDTGNVDDQAG